MRKGKRKAPKKRINFNYRTNDQIRVPEVRLISDKKDGSEDSFEPGKVYPTSKAKEIAESLELDLVEISPKAKPPVCKIVDVNKFKYELEKKQKELEKKNKKVETKEVRLTPNIGEGDIKFKMNHAINFLKKSNNVKVSMFFKGRTIKFKDLGEKVLLEFVQSLEEYGTPEGMPKMQGKTMIMQVRPKS